MDETQFMQTLARLNPMLVKKRNQGWAFAALFVACVIGSSVWADQTYATDDLSLFIFVAAALVMGLGGLNSWVVGAQQRLVMPVLVRSVDLEYQQNAKAFLKRVPPRLLPKAFDRAAWDYISGAVGNRSIEFAEIKIETGRKHRRTLFRGVVLRFENETLLPAFFIASSAQTDGWFSQVDTSGLVKGDQVRSKNGELYGIWLSREGKAAAHPALGAVVEILTHLETKIDARARLFSATSTGTEMHIALSNRRDLFRIGGLFATQDRISKSVTTALEDIDIPLRIAAALLEAERQTAQMTQG